MCVCLYVLAQTPILQDPNGHLLYMCMSVYVCLFVCLSADSHTPRLQWSPVVYADVCTCVYMCSEEDSCTPRPCWSPSACMYICACLST